MSDEIDISIERARQIAESTGCHGCSTVTRMLEEATILDSDTRRLLQRRLNALGRAKRDKVVEDNQLVREVLAEWRSVYPEHARKAAEPGSKRWEKIAERIRGGNTPEDLKLAPAGSKRNEWHQAPGRDGKPKTDINQIFFSEKMVEDLANLARGQQPEQRPTRDALTVLHDRLDGVKPRGEGQWSAQCPAHEDRHASLEIGLGDKGVLIRCQAGCDTQQVLQHVGLELRDLFTDDPQSPPVPARRVAPLPSSTEVNSWRAALMAHAGLADRIRELKGWTRDALEKLHVGWDGQWFTIPVRSAEGALLTVVRYSPKPPPGRKKYDALAGRGRHLFPDPEIYDGDKRWLCEGEGDAIAGTSLGLPVVSVPGVNGWRDEYAERFRGLRVVVSFDCDEPGRTAARKVAKSLEGLAREVRVVDLDPERGDGWDLSDAAVAGWSGDGLRDKARLVTPVFALRSA